MGGLGAITNGGEETCVGAKGEIRKGNVSISKVYAPGSQQVLNKRINTNTSFAPHPPHTPPISQTHLE